MLTADQLRTLAQQAQIDERTAVRWLAGLRVHRRCADRLARAWEALGWPHRPGLGIDTWLVPRGDR